MSEDSLTSRINALKKRIAYSDTRIKMSLQWIQAVEIELQSRPKLLLHFFERLAERNITIDEIFLTYTYSGLDNIDLNFQFLDLVLKNVGARRPISEHDFHKIPWGYIKNPDIEFKRLLTFKALMECKFNPNIETEDLLSILKKLPLIKIQGLIGNIRISLKFAELNYEAKNFWTHLHRQMSSDIKIIRYFLLLLFMQENEVSMPEFYKAFSCSRINNPEEIVLRLSNLKKSKERELTNEEYAEIDLLSTSLP